MSLEVSGRTLETDDNGHLLDLEEWDEEVAKAIAEKDGITELTDKHWDVINFMRESYIDDNAQPNGRELVKHFKKLWKDVDKVDSKFFFTLFPESPDKQSSKIAGLPRPKRKDGY